MDTKHFKEKLEEERAQLEAEISTEKKESFDTDTADETEMGDKFEQLEETEAVVNNLKTRLTEVENALTRISENTYGTCEVCNNPIEEDRLEANPAATTCKAHMNS